MTFLRYTHISDKLHCCRPLFKLDLMSAMKRFTIHDRIKSNSHSKKNFLTSCVCKWYIFSKWVLTGQICRTTVTNLAHVTKSLQSTQEFQPHFELRLCRTFEHFDIGSTVWKSYWFDLVWLTPTDLRSRIVFIKVYKQLDQHDSWTLDKFWVLFWTQFQIRLWFSLYLVK